MSVSKEMPLPATSSKKIRTAYHIAIFIDGYAAGWKIAVPKAFKDALDIKYTDRVAEGRKFKAWTQGSDFDFHEGDMFYDSPLAYNDWNKIKDSLKVIIQVRSKPVKHEMSFSIIQPIYGRDEHIIECKQSEFVGMLQTGLLQRHKQMPIDIFKKITTCGD